MYQILRNDTTVIKMIAVDFHCMYSINNVFCDIFIGRDKIVDFHWNSSDPWTIVSVSDDGESTGGGGTLQVCFFIFIVPDTKWDCTHISLEQ